MGMALAGGLTSSGITRICTRKKAIATSARLTLFGRGLTQRKQRWGKHSSARSSRLQGDCEVEMKKVGSQITQMNTDINPPTLSITCALSVL